MVVGLLHGPTAKEGVRCSNSFCQLNPRPIYRDAPLCPIRFYVVNACSFEQIVQSQNQSDAVFAFDANCGE